MENPLLHTDGLPGFDSIRPEHVEPAIRSQLADNRAQLQALLGKNASTFSSLVEPIEAMQHRLQRTWSPASHLNGVVNSPALRTAYNACLPLISEYQTELGQNENLYRAYAAILERDGQQLDATQRKLIDNALRDFRLAGVALDADRKARFRQLMQELAREQSRFEENVLDSANAWSRSVADVGTLRGLPDSVIARARVLAQEKGASGWLLTLDQPTYLAVLTHAEDEDLRRELYTAWSTRASEQGPTGGQWNNSAVIDSILQHRHEAATLLGFAHYAAFSLTTKMARSADEVRAFLENLAEHCVPVARAELAELERFAGRTLNAWDVPFYAERLQREQHDVSDEELRPYFPLPRVLAGLFAVAERLYGLKIREISDVAVWHPDVRYFEIRSAQGEVVGSFYVDPYARASKRSGAWMDECIGRLEFAARRVLPVAYLVCNFLPPVAGQPALLTHDEVITLFHEFGHGLHHLLTRVRYPSLAGINGVPWDAVELPSQFMENYGWNADVLRLISAHIDSGAQLPDPLIRRLRATRTFHAGLKAVRQLEFALFDLRLHSEYDPQRGSRLAQILAEVRERVAVVPAPAFNRFAHSFSHVFAGGYAAGYYSYKWAEVLAADAFAAFEEAGVFDAAVARRFLDSILSRGGSRDALEAFVEFRGRAPDIRPLLRQFGIAA
ncbi:MAG TPA: M3 family metallopeptidase [Steroidobacteraceae bacterium]|nr:M3 family metallopeptidase [Steroidobacteraceae bacterium]